MRVGGVVVCYVPSPLSGRRLQICIFRVLAIGARRGKNPTTAVTREGALVCGEMNHNKKAMRTALKRMMVDFHPDRNNGEIYDSVSKGLTNLMEILDAPRGVADLQVAQRRLCQTYVFKRDAVTVAELIQSLPIYQFIAFDTVLETHVIRSPDAATWRKLNDDLGRLREGVLEVFDAYIDYRCGDDDADDKDGDYSKERTVLAGARADLKNKNAINKDVLTNLISDDDTDRYQRCRKHFDGWRLCADDVIVHMYISDGLVCVESAPLHIDDHFLEDMRIGITSAQIHNIVDGNHPAHGPELEMNRVFNDAWHDEGALRHQHAVLWCMLFMTPLINKSKLFLLTLSDSDTAKDSQLYNPLRHLAPGIVKPTSAKFLYNKDLTNLGVDAARNNYSVVEAHPDIDLKQVDMNIIRGMYANNSETAVRDAHKSTLRSQSTFPVMYLIANYETYPPRGFPEAVVPKVLPMLAHIHDNNGERVGRVMRRFIDDNGDRIFAPDEDRPFIPDAYSDTTRAGKKWEHTNTYGSFLIRNACAVIAEWNSKRPDTPWHPMTSMPTNLRPHFNNYDNSKKHKRKREPALDVVSPEIAAAQVVVTTPSVGEYNTPDEALRALVGEVAKLYVSDVPGKWITPMVSPESRTQVTHHNVWPPGHRQPVTLLHMSRTQDVATRVKQLASPMVWKFIDGPVDIKNESTLVRSARELFTMCSGIEWKRQVGGTKYGNGIKVCGWHMMHCTLRELDTATVPATGSPSL